MTNLGQKNINALQDILGYKFQDISLLEEALTHPSTDAHTENTHKNYQRLEFLGDRVLGLCIAEILFINFPTETEGEIAKRHTVLVQAKALFEVAERIELGHYLSLSLGEHKSGGRHKMAVLADAAEAVIGAIYMDSDLNAAKDFIKRFWYDTMMSYKTPPTDAKTELQEWAQKRSLPLPHYVLLERSGTDHEPHFDIEVRIKGLKSQNGIGNSKRRAQKKAAEAMLKHIKAIEAERESK